MRPAKLALRSLLLVLAGAPHLDSETWAQAQSPQNTPTPTLHVYSRETIVDVTVTDAKGNPVHGLTRDDFTVKEDNKPQPIRSFHEYQSASIATPRKLPPNVYTNLQPPPASSAVSVFLLDFLNSAPDIPPEVYNGPLPVKGLAPLTVALQRQHLMKVDAISYLQRMPVGTRVSLLGMFQPGSLHVLQGVTPDPAILSAAIDATQYGTQSFANSKESWCAQQEQRNRSTLESFNQIAVDLAAIKGRKNLIWFTVGLRSITDPVWRPSCLTDPTKDLQKAYALLAAAQVTVFPVSVRGVEEPSAAEAADLLSMESVAEATGGAAFYNSNDVASLVAQAIDKASDYYTLTYAPPGQKYDWAHHTIKVEVNKPDMHLVYRQTYDAVDPATIKPTSGLVLTTDPPEVRAGNMQASMSRSMPTSQQILFDVQVEPSTIPASPNDPPILGTLDPTIKAKLKGKPLTRYGFQYAVPASQINFTAAANGTRKGSLELDLAAYDTDGKLVTGLSQTVSMPLSDARYQEFIKGPFRFNQQLDLPPGQFFLRIGVLDPASNKVGTLEIPLTVPKK